MKEERIEIRMSTEQKRKLKRKADKVGMSISEAIRYAVQKWIEQ